MSEEKNKKFTFTAGVFSGKLFSVIAATMLLLVADGAIHDSSAGPYNPADYKALDMEARLERLEIANNMPKTVTRRPSDRPGAMKNLVKLEQIMKKLESLVEIKPPLQTKAFLLYLSDRLDTLEQAFANNSPATQQTSVQQDITSTGNSATQTPYPMAVCNALVNGQNLCTEQTVTAVVGALAVGLIGGIVAIVQTEINNKQNTDKQRENSNNLLTLLLLSQKKQQQCDPQTCPP